MERDVGCVPSRVAVTTRLTLEKDGAVVREEGVPARHFEPLVLNQGVALHRARL